MINCQFSPWDFSFYEISAAFTPGNWSALKRFLETLPRSTTGCRLLLFINRGKIVERRGNVSRGPQRGNPASTRTTWKSRTTGTRLETPWNSSFCCQWIHTTWIFSHGSSVLNGIRSVRESSDFRQISYRNSFTCPFNCDGFVINATGIAVCASYSQLSAFTLT